jgi:ankyrin repeat protein
MIMPKDLPEDFIFDILSYSFSPAAVIEAQSNPAKLQAMLSNAVWQEKLKKHFPDYKIRKEQQLQTCESDYCYKLFVKQYHREYRSVPSAGFSASGVYCAFDCKKIFTLIKEGDLQGFKRAMAGFTSSDLRKQDHSGKTMLDWAYIHKRQDILDFVYQNLQERYKNYFLIKCNQHQKPQALLNALPANDIEELNQWLIDAAKYGDKACIESLIKKGASIQEQDETGKTPLYLAVCAGHVDCLPLLIDKDKLLVNARSSDCDDLHRTPLHRAALGGRVACIEFLLANGGQVAMQDDYGKTPLYLAASAGHSACVKILIEQGSDVNCAARKKRTPLHIAAKKGYAECIKLLKAGQAKTNGPDRYGFTPLFYAAISGHAACMELLWDEGIDINQGAGWANSTLLHVAVQSGDMDSINLILAKKANINAVNGSGATPLDLAVQREDVEVIRLLLARGGSENAEGAKLLFWAAENGYVDIVANLLTRRDVDFNCKNQNGETLLDVAVTTGQTRVAKLLVDKGACLEKIDVSTLLDKVSEKLNYIQADVKEMQVNIAKLKHTDLSLQTAVALWIMVTEITLYPLNKEDVANKQQCIDDFAKLIEPSRLTTVGKILGLILGLAIGLFVGAVIGVGLGMALGAWTGPGMALTGTVGLVSGAMAGVTKSAAIGLAAGTAASGIIGTALASYGFFKPTAEQSLLHSAELAQKEDAKFLPLWSK